MDRLGETVKSVVCEGITLQANAAQLLADTAQRNSQPKAQYPRTLKVAFLTFLPIRTAAIKASIHSTEAVSCHASSRNTTSISDAPAALSTR